MNNTILSFSMGFDDNYAIHIQNIKTWIVKY
jgi:hypothetical protein